MLCICGGYYKSTHNNYLVVDHKAIQSGCGYCMVAVAISFVLYWASPGRVVGFGRAEGTKVVTSLYALSERERRMGYHWRACQLKKCLHALPLHPSTSRLRSSNEESYGCSQTGCVEIKAFIVTWPIVPMPPVYKNILQKSLNYPG